MRFPRAGSLAGVLLAMGLLSCSKEKDQVPSRTIRLHVEENGQAVAGQRVGGATSLHDLDHNYYFSQQTTDGDGMVAFTVPANADYYFEVETDRPTGPRYGKVLARQGESDGQPRTIQLHKARIFPLRLTRRTDSTAIIYDFSYDGADRLTGYVMSMTDRSLPPGSSMGKTYTTCTYAATGLLTRISSSNYSDPAAPTTAVGTVEYLPGVIVIHYENYAGPMTLDSLYFGPDSLATRLVVTYPRQNDVDRRTLFSMVADTAGINHLRVSETHYKWSGVWSHYLQPQAVYHAGPYNPGYPRSEASRHPFYHGRSFNWFLATRYGGVVDPEFAALGADNPAQVDYYDANRGNYSHYYTLMGSPRYGMADSLRFSTNRWWGGGPSPSYRLVYRYCWR